MPKAFPDLERGIVDLLHSGRMRQVDIVNSFPQDRYLDVGHAVRALAARGVVEREKCGATYWVRLRNENTKHNG